MKILWGMSGSFCNHAVVMEQLEKMCEKDYNIQVILTQNVTSMDTRFGLAKDRLVKLEEITKKPVLTTLQEAERTGPIDHFDVMIIAPMTATVLSKLNLGIYDNPVTLAAKAMLRNQKPLICAIASNDYLGISGVNLLQLKQMRHIFFVPFYQDDCVRKPNSLVSEWSLIEKTMENALQDHQIQPILVQPSKEEMK